MFNPHYYSLALKKIPKRYLLVNILSRRMRQLQKGSEPLVQIGEGNSISDEEKMQDSDIKKHKSEEKNGSSSKKRESPIPEINFATFILSLSSSAMLHFGDIEDPVSGRKERNLTIAKQTIDMIDMLREKTKGNLTKDEEGLMENILYELKIRYVKESGKEM